MLSRRLLAGVVAVVLCLSVRAARAQDAFEIQVYDAETAPPGTIGFEMHANHFVEGQTEATPPELPTHHATHLTLEPHIGIAPWCEAGAYIQTAIRGDGQFDFAGIKLRFKARVPRRLADLVGLALNFELSSVPQEYEAVRFGIELRPIVDVKWKRLYVSLNPIVGFELAGPIAGHPVLEPAAKVAVQVLPWLSIGPEYYADLGPVDAIERPENQVHRLFGALDFEHSFGRVKFDANVAAGYGFLAGEKWIVKAIVAFDFEGAMRPVGAKSAD